jgi:two-component system phosphate regulon sensor histidine kinase PhoR
MPHSVMMSGSRRLAGMISKLLELSRLQNDDQSGQDEWVNVPAMLMQLKEQAEELSRGKHELIFKVQPDLFLSGIPADLESAFSNLIRNAVKYTPKKGSVTVTWEEGADGPRLIVRDTGIGIPRRDLPRVTERFYRVGSDRAKQSGGTGLGLAIVKHVLNAHQAKLTIESELGEGSEFICSFPRDRVRSEDTNL